MKKTEPRKRQEIRVNGKRFICVICECGKFHMVDRDIQKGVCQCGAKLSLR